MCPETSSSGVIQASQLPAQHSATSIPSQILLQPQQGAVLMQQPAVVASPGLPAIQHLDLLQTQTLLTNQRAVVYPQVC